MNRIYSLVYNVTLGQVQVASELAGGAVVSTRPQQRAGWRRQVMALAVGLLVTGGGLAQTLPSGGVVAGGTVTIGPGSGSRLDIIQSTPKAVINWTTFSIGAGGTVDFQTPGSSNAVTLNIVGANGGISQIDGTLSSTGHMFLLNQNGVLFGDTARVNVAGLVASAAGYTHDGSLHEQGTYLFDATGQTSAVTVAAGAVLTAAGPIILLGSKVTNNGTIQSTAGAVNLFGSDVVNDGSIAAGAGIITLQAGTAATLNYSGESSPVLVDGSALQAGQGVITNTGSLQAVDIHIRSPYQASAINVGGVVMAGNLLELSQGGGGMTLGGSLSSVDEVSINSGSGSVMQTVGSLAARELLLATEGGGQATPPAFNAARSVSLSSTTNAISSISGDVAGNFDVVNTALNGRLDQLRVAGELDLNATGNMTLSNVAAGTMKASAGALRVTGGVVGGRADLTARNAALVIHGLEVGGDLQAKGVGLQQTGSLAVDGDASLDAGTAALSFNNASVDGDLTATGLAITQTGSLTVGGTADLDSPSAIALANVTAAALDVTTGKQLQIAGGNVTGHAGLSAATSMTLSNLGAGSIIAAADALDVSGLTVGTNATLTSRAAALSLDNVSVGGNLQANGVGLSQTGTLDVGGDADLNAGTAALSLNNASVDGDLTATGSDITQTGALVVSGNADLDARTATLSLNSATVDGDLTARGNAITQTGSLAVGGAADLDSPGAIALANVTAGALDVTTGNRLQIAGGNVTGHAGLSAATSMTLSNLGAGSITAAADALDVSGLTTVNNAVLTSRTSVLSLGNVSVGGNLQANGVGLSQTGTLDVGGDADLNAGTAALSLNNASVDGDLTARGRAISQTGTLAVDGDADLNAGTAALSLNNATVDGDLTATGSDITQTGSLAVGGTADLDSAGAIKLANVTADVLYATSGNQLQIAGGNVTGHAGLSAATSMALTNLGAGSIIAAADVLDVSGLTTVNNATLTSRSVALSLDNVAVGGNLLANGVGLSQTGTLDVGGDADLNAGTAALSLHNASVDGDLTASGSAITQTGALAVGGTADLDSAGAIALANVNAAALDVTSGNRLQIAGGNVTGHAGLSAATSMTLTNLGAGSIIAAADALDVSGLTVDTNAALTSRAAALSLDNVAVGGNLQANGVGLSQTGTLDVGGDATLDAGTAALLLNNATVDGDLTATGSAITQTGSLAVGGTADLDSPGAIALANITATALDVTTGNQLQIAGGNVTSHAGLSAATSMTLSNLGAGSIIAAADALDVSGLTVGTNAALTSRAAALSLDNVAVGGNLQANGVGLSQTGMLDVDGDADLNAGTAALSLHNASVDGDLTARGRAITQTGALVVSGNADIDARTATLSLNSATVDGDLTASGSAITQTGSLTVGGAADLDSAGAIALTNVTAAALDVTTGNRLQIAGGNVTGHAGLSAATSMTLSNLGAGSIIAAADALDVSGLTVGTNATLTSRAAALSLGNVAVGGNLQANGVGLHQTGTLDVGGDADLNAGTAALSLNNASVDGNLTASGSAITQTGSLAVGGVADLDSAGAISLTNVTAAALDVTTGNQLQIAGGTVTGNAGLSAATAMTLTNLGAGSIIAAADALDASGLTVDANAALTSRTAALSLDNVAVGGNLQANGVGLSQTGTLDVGGDATLDAGTAALSLNNVAVGGNLQANGVGLHQTGTLEVGGDADLNAGTAALSLNNAIVDGDLSASGSAITQTGSLAVGGTVDLDSPGSINLRDVTARSLDITSGEQLQIAGATVAGGATLDAAGELKLADMFVGGQLRAAASAISQSGALSVGRSSELQAAGRIVLDHAGNHFAGPVALRAQQASIVSAAGLELASVDVGDLQANTGGQLAVGTANIAGAAHLSGNGVLLGAVTVGSDLQVDSAAGIAQQAALQVHGDTLLSAGGAIALEHAGNDFVGGVAAQGASIRLVDRNALDLQALGNHGGSGEIHVLAAGDLGVAGQGVDAGTGNLSLQSVGGRIVQSAGQVVAGHLQVAALGAVDLQGDNRIAALGDVWADGLKLVNHGDLRVSGNVQAGSDAMLDARGGSLQLDGQLSASQLRLLSEGDIVQGSSSLLQADTLSGRSGGSTVLGTAAGFVANQVAMLGDFSAAGGFSLTNARSLSLGALNGSAFSVNAGTADLLLKVEGGDLLQNGQAPVLAGMSYWWSSGRIGTLLDPIHLVTSTGALQVDYVGAPPAYFHATTQAGVPVVVTGAVNAFSFDGAAREQTGAMWRQPPLGLPAGDQQAAPIRVDGPGMALPAKPATACAGSSADTLCMQ